jgi:thiol-disulfide isomerase/thioredoxin
MRARQTGVLTAGAASLALLLAACGGPAAPRSSALGAASPDASSLASSAPRSSGAPAARSRASARPGRSGEPTASGQTASPGTTTGRGGGPASSAAPTATSLPTTRAYVVSTACRKPASSVGSGLALPRSKPAPFTGTQTDCGGSLDFTSYTSGKPTLVTFFASWCEPCHQEAKDLEALYEKYHVSKGFQVIGVDTQDESGSPSWFYTDAKWSFPSVWDDGEKIEKAWNQSGATSTLPASFWIHPDGTISSIDAGAMSRSQMEDEFNKL